MSFDKTIVSPSEREVDQIPTFACSISNEYNHTIALGRDRRFHLCSNCHHVGSNLHALGGDVSFDKTIVSPSEREVKQIPTFVRSIL